MNENEIELLKQIWEHFDQIGDGAPDSSYAARQALNFSEPLRRLIDRAEAANRESPHPYIRESRERPWWG